jgi:signal transduction histidine kinase
LDLAELTNKEPLQSVCLSNLAIINQQLKNEREALKYQRKGLALALKNNQVREEAGNYFGMGHIYKNLEIMDSALYFYKKALPLYKQVDSKKDIALVNTNIGGLLVYLNQPDSGMYYLESAKHDFMLLNDTINIANSALNMGDAWYRMANVTQDRSYLNNALKEMLVCKKLAELKELEDLKMNCYYWLSIIYDALGNNALAFDYLKRYQLINNVIRSKEYTGQIAEMQTKYETERKELEITKLNAAKLLDEEKLAGQRTLNYSLLAIAALLLISGFLIFRNAQHKRAVEKQVAILEKQNAIESMRNKIASDVHDEMGANLTRLGLNAQQLLQSPSVPEKEKQLAEKMALQSKEIITGMREIIWASNPANDNLKSMLGFMRQYIDRFFDGTNIRPVVNFPHDVGEVTLHPEVRRNLFFILKESLNNAIKYSGTDRIDIDFRNENESFNLHIKDYGKGIDDSNKAEFSNGLSNMKMRAELIQSLFKLITAPGQGVQISIEGKLY